MIDAITTLPKLDVDVLQRILSDVKNQSTGMVYATTAANAKKQADSGKLVVMDDGVDRRIYFKTGEGGVGYIALTMA